MRRANVKAGGNFRMNAQSGCEANAGMIVTRYGSRVVECPAATGRGVAKGTAATRKSRQRQTDALLAEAERIRDNASNYIPANRNRARECTSVSQ